MAVGEAAVFETPAAADASSPAQPPSGDVAASAAARVGALLRAGAAVGQHIQTYYPDSKRWYDGRVADAWVAPFDDAAGSGGPAAYVKVRYAKSLSEEVLRLDEPGAPNAAVAYALGTRTAWVRVEGFPWHGARRVPLSRRHLQRGDGVGGCHARHPARAAARAAPRRRGQRQWRQVQ